MHISNKCSLAVHCLIFVREYGEETRVTSELLSRSSGCNPVTIRNIMSALKKDGMIRGKGGAEGVELGCPPEEITLYRICVCVEPEALEKLIGIHRQPSQICPVGRNIHAVLEKSYGKVREGLKASLQAVTLRDILEDYEALT